ncbi:MAG: ABC transporter ATP-binding protein, partial [Pseudomonadota bacterium]
YFVQPYRRIIFGFLGYRTIRYTYFALLPVIFGLVINAFETGEIREDPSRYVWMMIGYFIPYVLMQITNHIFAYEAAAYEKVSRAMTLMGVQHLTTLSVDWHEQEGSGGKLQRIMNARKAFAEIGIIFRWVMFPVFGNLIGAFIAITTMNAPFYYIFLYAGMFVTYQYVSWYMGRSVSGMFDAYYAKIEQMMSGVYEFVSSIRTVKAFNLNSYIQDKANVHEERGQEAIAQTLWVIFSRWVCMNATGYSWLALFAGLGFYLTLEGMLSVGAYATTFFIAFNLLMAMEFFGTTQERLYDYSAGLRRFIDTMNEEPKILDIEPLKALSEDWKDIKMSNLSFHYNEKDNQGVHDLNFTVKRGEKIAFVGESGAGKSTLVKLLMKQMLPGSGSIEIDGQNLNHIPTAQWLAEIGFVPQDVELFNMSIRDNILIDRQDIDEAIYTRALEHAALKDFIDSLPEGDGTMIGERGIKLSGGQRQRLGIARALVREAEIIIFDEATSSLDSISEQKIQTAMENSFVGHTVFLVAHRLSTVRHVDKIIVLDRGRIVESGSFDELIAAKGTFAELWNIQSKTDKEIQKYASQT